MLLFITLLFIVMLLLIMLLVVLVVFDAVLAVEDQPDRFEKRRSLPGRPLGRRCLREALRGCVHMTRPTLKCVIAAASGATCWFAPGSARALPGLRR
jgi:hypothetical protein